MKFKINKLSVKSGNKDGKPWTLFKFINTDGYEYSAFAQSGYTDNFKDGYEFEAPVTEKPNPKGGTYKNIQWPKQPRSGDFLSQRSDQHPLDQLTRMEKSQQRIEQKLDQLLGKQQYKYPQGPNVSGDIPYSDSLPPTDEDAPF